MKYIFLIFILYGGFACGQVANYSFSSSSGSYTAINGGTKLIDGISSMDSWVCSAAQTIPSFNFNGTNYTTAWITSNGLLSLGGSAPSSTAYTGISAGSGSGICICPFNADLDKVNSDANTEIRWETIGNEIVFQWKQLKRYLQTENFDFQVRLNTSNGVIKFIYQLNSGPGTGTSYFPQVGIRSSVTDFLNRKVSAGAETWANSLSGTVNTDVCRFTSTSVAQSFVSGLTYTYTPPCYTPSSVTSSSVTATTATISWTAPGLAPANGYEYEVRTSGAAGSGPTGLTTGGSASAGVVSADISGLTGSTQYYVYVRSNCTSGYSSWTASYSFTTLCTSVTSFPWSENFDGVTIPAFPNCWLKQGTGDWVTTNNSNHTADADARSGTQFLRETYSATNEYIWTPGFQMTSGSSYNFSFYWAGDNYSGWTGDIFYNTSQSSTGATQLGSSFVTSGTSTTKTYAQCSNNFVAPSSTTYYFAIRVNASAVPMYLSFDDFSVTLNASNSSDITEKSGYSYNSNIPYNSYLVSDITGGPNDIEIAKFTIRDGGSASNDADALGTTLSSITFNVSNWTNIRRIALYNDSGTEVGTEQAGAASVTFSGLSITAPDNSSIDFSVRVSYNSSVTDNSQNQLTITAASTTGSTSTFAASNAGGASSSISGDNNRIEVTADRLNFSQQPVNVCTGSNISPAVTVTAIDANGNTDLDYTSPGSPNIDITASGATPDFNPSSAAPVSGVATFSTLSFSGAGSGISLTAIKNGGGWDIVSSTFTVGGIPGVTTHAVTTIAGTTASGNGDISSIGGGSISQHGVCWNTTGSPTIGDSKTTDGASGVGAYSSSMTSLSECQNYFVKSYATNSCGTAYGNEVTFVTRCAASDIISGGNETSDIDYASKVGTSISATADAVKLWSFTIRDGGGASDSDIFGTILTAITISKGAGNTVSSWANTIKQAALYDGNTEVAEISVTGETMVFGSFSSIAEDGGSKTLDLYVTFETTGITDNQRFQFESTNANVTTQSTNSSAFSSFAAASSDISVDNNKIEVTASLLAFVQQPSQTIININMSPSVTVSANDANGNRDLDFTSSIDIISSGTLNSSPQTVAASSGLAIFATINHTTTGSGLLLTAQRNGTADWSVNSNSFNIIAIQDAFSTSAPNILFNPMQGNLSVATKELGCSYGAYMANNGVTAFDNNYTYHCQYTNSGCSTTPASNQKNKTDFVDVWYKVVLPTGTTQMTLYLTGLGAADYIAFMLYTGTGPDASANSTNVVTTATIDGSTNKGGAFFSNTTTSHSITNLSAGGTYYVRIMGAYPSNLTSSTCGLIPHPSNFTIEAQAPQSNDTWAGAIDVTLNNAGSLHTGNYTAAASEGSDERNCVGGSVSTKDLFYKVSYPNTGSLQNFLTEFKLHGTVGQQVRLLVYNTTAASAASHADVDYCQEITLTGNEDVTYFGNLQTSTAAGTSRRIQIMPVSGTVGNVTVSANVVFVNNNCSWFNNTLPGYNLNGGSAALKFNYANASGIGGLSGKDLWFQVTNASSKNQSITLNTTDQTPNWDGEVSLILYSYPGTSVDCNGLTEFCRKDNIDDFDLESGVTFNLGPVDYLLRVVETTVDGAGDQLNTTITGTASVAVIAANSVCSGALDITSSGKTGDFSRALLPCPGGTYVSCEGTNYNSIPTDLYYGAELWYKFTMPGTACSGTLGELVTSTNVESVTISVSGLVSATGSTSKAAYLELYSDCNTRLDCGKTLSNSTSVNYSGLTSGQTYYLKAVNNTSLSTSTNTNFTISMTSGNVVPCNNTYQEAVVAPVNNLAQGRDCFADASSVTYSAKGGDAWFTYVQPDNSGSGEYAHISILIKVTGNTGLTVTAKLFSNPTGSPIASDVIDSYGIVNLQAGTLNPGATYYVKIENAELPGVNLQYEFCISHEDEIDLCPSTTAGDFKDRGIECDQNDCNMRYAIDLSDGAPSAYYRVEVSYASGANSPTVIMMSNAGVQSGVEGTVSSGGTIDRGHPCAATGSVGSVANGTWAGASSCGTDITWAVFDLIDQYMSPDYIAYDYALRVWHHTDVVNCGGLQLCNVKLVGPFEKNGTGLANASSHGVSPAGLDTYYCSLFDFSDLQNGSTYPVPYALYTDKDPRDGLPDDGVFLGDAIDDETDGSFAGTNADGDDTDGSNDEDGMNVIEKGNPGGIAKFRIKGSSTLPNQSVYVGFWIDWDGDGFENNSEEFYTASGTTPASKATVKSVNIDIDVDIPAGFVAGSSAMVLIKAAPDALLFTDLEIDLTGGEVEGYKVTFGDIVLPVELAWFKGLSFEKENKLFWNTLTEQNSDYFLIQKSLDSKKFETIGMVKAKGNSNSTEYYEFSDFNFSDLNYYRLKQIDYNGATFYSDIIAIDREEDKKYIPEFDVFPNPAKDKLIINSRDKFENFDFILTDIVGKPIIIKELIDNTKAGYTIDISKLSPGSYFVVIKIEGQTIVKKVVRML